MDGSDFRNHLEESLRPLDFKLEKSEWEEIEKTVAAIPIVGSRYNTEQQKQFQ